MDYSLRYVKSVLSKSKVSDYTINPYVGCENSCAYCYARFMKRVLGIKEPWGSFVYVKINAPEVLKQEIAGKRKGVVWISGVCDPYQPAEAEYQITRKCLAVLLAEAWPIQIQTKCPIVLRDIDLLKQFTQAEVGFSIATADEKVKLLFELKTSSIVSRIDALEQLHAAGIRTFVMIAPILPGAEKLMGMLVGKVDYVLVDKMNYNHAMWVYEKYGLEYALTSEFFADTAETIEEQCRKQGIPCRKVF
jgi:DNA repair photolyase